MITKNTQITCSESWRVVYSDIHACTELEIRKSYKKDSGAFKAIKAEKAFLVVEGKKGK
ncbi:hypothetical protein N0O92_12220 [Alkalihalobacillus sp. MEB130]|uniref:hypothetical protein n=1 Tax=Alkalihalobacillus sp. MEB130 TaxID=2976704 RepID=UPI0028E0150E|nr:hypothetical protein [Alkalihalobacillus sp. MEB130]MDT8860999.1 hypothetical protein [Alkalihalobacillus sp. MEB130]